MLLCRKYVHKKIIKYYVYFHTFTVPREWLNFKWNYLVVLHPSHITYYK